MSRQPAHNDKTPPRLVRLSPRIIGGFLFVLIVAVVEIQFSGASWNIVYPLLKNTLGFLDGFFANTEQLAGTYTFASILLVIWIFDKRYRHTIAPFLLALIVVSTVVTAIKFPTGRARPMYGWKMETEQKEEIRAYLARHSNPILKDVPGDYWTWFNRPVYEEDGGLSVGDYSSFPSGHSAGSFLIAAYLSALYARAAWLWYLLAAGCALSRVRFRRHYPGDILVGGAMGWLTFYIFFSMVWPYRFGAKVERIATNLLTKVGLEKEEPPPV